MTHQGSPITEVGFWRATQVLEIHSSQAQLKTSEEGTRWVSLASFVRVLDRLWIISSFRLETSQQHLSLDPTCGKYEWK